MLKNYIKVALRNIQRNKIYSGINIFGLATAITLCLLIILFVIDQASMDKHMPDRDLTYRILTNTFNKDRNKFVLNATSPYQSLELLRINHPEIGEVTRMSKVSGEIGFEERIFNFTGLYAEQNFIRFFNYDMGLGADDALSRPNSVVLSKEMTDKLFPSEDPIGKQVDIKGQGSFLVTGVVNDLESRSHIDFEILLSFSSYNHIPESTETKEDWIAGSKTFYNYFKTDSEDLAAIENSLSGFNSLLPPQHQSGFSFELQPLKEISMGDVVLNDMGFVTPFFVPWFLGILAAVVMLSATFNYVGLAIALALKRAKEVGIRKIVGARWRQVLVQFLVEAQVTVLASWVLSLALLSFLLPAYNSLKVLRDIDGQIRIDLMDNLHIYGIFFAFAVFLGLIAGLYPAWYIGKMPFKTAITRPTKKSPSFLLRKSLVFLQYSTSVVFIITAIVIYKQSVHFFQLDYGFDQTNLINVPLKEIPYQPFKSELLRNPAITHVSASTNLPGLDMVEKSDIYTPGDPAPRRMAMFGVNEDFLGNFSIDLLTGRNFDPDLKSDEQAVLVNQKAMDVLAMDFNADAMIRIGENGEWKRVIGVVDEFKYEIAWRESGPLILTNSTSGLVPQFVNIRYSDLGEKEAALEIENIWRQFNKHNPFEYTQYEFVLYDMYDEFMDIAWIVGSVAILAILIACLGQFGMILHHVQLRIKEVGIRKALGASLNQLIYLLSRGYFVVIGLSILAGTPVAWWINDYWTNRIGYSVSVTWWTIILGLTLVFVLAIVSILSLAWKTSNTNPVESLRYE